MQNDQVKWYQNKIWQRPVHLSAGPQMSKQDSYLDFAASVFPSLTSAKQKKLSQTTADHYTVMHPPPASWVNTADTYYTTQILIFFSFN